MSAEGSHGDTGRVRDAPAFSVGALFGFTWLLKMSPAFQERVAAMSPYTEITIVQDRTYFLSRRRWDMTLKKFRRAKMTASWGNASSLRNTAVQRDFDWSVTCADAAQQDFKQRAWCKPQKRKKGLKASSVWQKCRERRAEMRKVAPLWRAGRAGANPPFRWLCSNGKPLKNCESGVSDNLWGKIIDRIKVI